MKTIKVLSWNVEHFKMEKKDEVAGIIKSLDPDVFGIYEVEAKGIYGFMREHFPKHTVFITEGQQSQEILVACRNSFHAIKFQQKREFRSGNPRLRPGAFLTFEYPGKGLYHFLFLHTDSGTGAVDFGNRTEMFNHAYNLKRKLDFDSGHPVNFLMLGDLNTMGLKYPKSYKSNQIADTSAEMTYLDFYADRRSGRSRHKRLKPQVRRLTKPPGTYHSKRYGISDLDHIIASNHLTFVPQQNHGETETHDIKLYGWREHMDDPEKLEKFTREISDHCLLYCELITK